MEEHERLRKAKLDELRQSIRAGLESGPAEPLIMEDIIAEARRRQSSKSESQG